MEQTRTFEALQLQLEVDEPNIVKYLSEFEDPVRKEKALEALRVGVIAIQSASPILDTSVVEEKFREVETSVISCLGEFKDDLYKKLEDNFKPESGILPRSLDSIFGTNGTVPKVFEHYFCPETGKVTGLLEKQLGPSSTFAKSLDPSYKEGIICRIEDTVKNRLKEKTDELINQFSLDIPGSALTRLKSCLSNEIEKLKEDDQKFFTEIKTALGIEKGKKLEAERGTQKGSDFEEALYEYVAAYARQLGDASENSRAIIGLIPRTKTGDYVVTLGETSGSPGSKIVVEAKNEQGYKLKKAIAELKEAKENRSAVIGILAFEKNCAPVEIGDFLKVGDDFFVTIDEEAMNEEQPLLYLETAYKISRALIVMANRKEQAAELDFTHIESELGCLVELAKRFSEIITKARTISTSSKFIEQNAQELKEDIEKHLDIVGRLLRQGKALEENETEEDG